MSPFVRTIASAFVFAFALTCGPDLLAQQAQPQSEQALEDQYFLTRAEQGESHASGMRPDLGPVILGNPAQSVVVLRVGLYWSWSTTGAYSEFASLHHPFVEVSHTEGAVHVVDRGAGKQILSIEPGIVVRVSFDGTGYQVSAAGSNLGTFGGPIYFRPTDGENRFRIDSVRRGQPTASNYKPLYRGAIEVARGTATLAGRVNLVNYVELEDYVPGVVTNESIASFHLEALKAQAVAARGYAVANIGRFVRSGYPFDIVDSSSSQVYRGLLSEHPRGVQASNETIGLVASYDGQIITALYSSSFGGHSEHNEWIFNDPPTMLPGTNATPYLRGIYDGDGVPPDFSSEAGVAAFWTVPQPNIFDDCVRVGNRFSRWRIVLSAAFIKSRMPGRSVLLYGDLTGNITDVALLTRMEGSARIAVARIGLTSGAAEVRGWDNLRNVLGRTEKSTPAMCVASNIAANFTLNNPSVLEVMKNADGTVNAVTAWGGGWGHNTGLSQYGSNGRARAGQSFQQILKAYYTGVDVGAYPIDIGRTPGTGTPTLRQQFYAPTAEGTLVVRPSGLAGLRVHINETFDLALDKEDLASDVVIIDLSPYLIVGLNTIQYNPVGRGGTATVTVVIE